MKLYHQTGHNYKWNLESFQNDKAGDGLILSPINIDYNKLLAMDDTVREKSIFDPQLFIPTGGQKGLLTYEYFPSSILESFQSSDYSNIKNELAKRYIEMLTELSFKNVIIPNKYSEIESSDYHEAVYENFIKPHCDQLSGESSINKYLTVFINKTKLLDPEARDTLLDWLTGLNEIDGIYILFDIKRTSKQIKEPDVLAESLFFINVLKKAGKKVLIGYTNTEGILYSIANPDAISCGSYENLRNFNMTIKRFNAPSKKKQYGPNARLYSATLFQWIEETFIKAIQQLYSNFEDVFSDSKYKPLMFTSTFNWHFSKSELYKHFFIEVSNQVKALPSDIEERKKYLIQCIKKALKMYDEMNISGILFDSDSDCSHLVQWFNAISLYEKYNKERL